MRTNALCTRVLAGLGIALLMACEEDGAAAQAAALAAIDSVHAADRAAAPFESIKIAVGDSSVSVSFDLQCTERGETVASLVMLGPDAGKAFVSTVSAPVTTRVVTQIDSAPPTDERWYVGGLGDIVAFSPMPVSLGQRLRGAKRLRLSLWPYGGDSTAIELDVTHAGARLQQVAADCRWPG